MHEVRTMAPGSLAHSDPGLLGSAALRVSSPLPRMAISADSSNCADKACDLAMAFSEALLYMEFAICTTRRCQLPHHVVA